jgi:energy-coupling factor transporter ATP-binding protein EcfA2
MKQNVTLRDKDLREINNMISAYAEMELEYDDIYLRVAPYKDGLEIDLGDDLQTRVRMMSGNVELITKGSGTKFYRSNVTLPFDPPAQQGDFRQIRQYLNNLQPDAQILIIAWISYTLAHPKISSSKFVHLILVGSQGSGKSFLCRLIARFIDPSSVGLQVLPRNTKDLVVAAQNAHLLLYDNVRKLSQSKSDDLCIAGTGGAMSTKKLYTDDDQSVSYLHVALVLNGIYDFITESDLASRSLIMYLQDMDESERLSEVDLEQRLEKNMPSMLAGLFQLIADILEVLPRVQVTHPERMIDFSQWLAAMEMVDGASVGAYQQLYSKSLEEAQLNTLLENELAAAVYRLGDRLERVWTGTAADLLRELNDTASHQAMRSVDWPKSPESLGSRLRTLKPALTSQGVFLRFYRSGDRMIEINTTRIEDMY